MKLLLGERCEFLAIAPKNNDSSLRLTPDERRLPSAVAWVDLVRKINRAKGRPVADVQCGDLQGCVVEFVACDDWIRGWALAAGGFPLDATYRCKAADAGRDDAIVGWMLNSLRLERQSS